MRLIVILLMLGIAIPGYAKANSGWAYENYFMLDKIKECKGVADYESFKQAVFKKMTGVGMNCPDPDQIKRDVAIESGDEPVTDISGPLTVMCMKGFESGMSATWTPTKEMCEAERKKAMKGEK